ncbi:hypothetical protein Bacsa_3696 (plasmid) [Phocaeicola salanitronis DSM 18170]|uniref:Uncharacterized protein n=1 Tax=Phocaeicola salanitronis (strain DSM 18170 / JCM 13657 / CCUG 60908 / BL78) TaxID=667015 RepID=F0R996_PHOSB|nr:hypothetical protein [Phocaeicola salanitronis]ADY38217.1 hypothetical protein Bacsa_3696 [Phocaeicola salanitronis DSM 18170]
MEDKKFTLRISEAESEKLERLKKVVGVNTYTGVIKCLISQYEDLNVRYLNEREANVRLKKENQSLQLKINTFLDAFNNLK